MTYIWNGYLPQASKLTFEIFLCTSILSSMEDQSGQKEHFLISINDFLISINDFLISINDFLILMDDFSILVNGMIS